MPGHSVLGPSSADRWMQCYGSVALCQGLEDRASNAADEGSCYHHLGALCLTTGRNAAEFVGQTLCQMSDDTTTLGPITVSEPTIRYQCVIDADNAEYLQMYIDYVRTLAFGPEGSKVVDIEQWVSTEEYSDEKDGGGTADAIVINVDQRELAVIDLKFGRGVEVDATDNRQMMLYALGALDKYSMAYEIETVRCTIMQPRSGEGKPKEWVIPVAALIEFGVKVKRAAKSVWAALELYNQIPHTGDIFDNWADTYLLDTEKGCQWCRAKSRCPKIRGTIVEATAVGFDDLTQTELPVIIAELPGLHPNEILARLMDKTALIEGWISAVRAEVESELTAGREVPRYKLVRGKRGNRDWNNDQNVIDLCKKTFRLRDDVLYDFKLKSPTALEKLAEKPTKKKDAVVVEKPIKLKQWEKLAALVIQPDGKLSVAPESDPRPAESVAANADGMTAEVDDGSELV